MSKFGHSMPVYTVHLPEETKSGLDPATEAVLVREGFSLAAFLFGPLWLIWHQRWLALVLWLVAIGGFVGLSMNFGFRPGLFPLFYLALVFLIGLEAAAMRRRRLEGRGFDFVDIAIGEKRIDAETVWLARRRPTGVVSAPIAASPPVRTTPLVGLFPDPAAGRTP
ncbi:DUF2628 domain-containing protein [Roseiarcaceae bacterium H3SJ34-1]|uniref:DUF2628 domain-containing protein n=1 Tax=Terripilifer ovatus TaxID=3032367 RepID=UPI003AB9A4EA|nr:DUF2628 domain-containing protein [Roseiarcaceae bacterium H3SJ34-1]